MQRSYTILVVALLSLGTVNAEFQLPPLPFSPDATEPVISEQANIYHHDNHHAGYTDGLNSALSEAEDESLKDLTLDRLITLVGTDELPEDLSKKIRNSGGGYLNHVLWWRQLAYYDADVTKPIGSQEGFRFISPEFQKAIDDKFGDNGNPLGLTKAIQEKAGAVFGSGWVWVIVQEDGKLKVITTPNQDNPLMAVVPEEDRGFPILGLDVWEHAFYLSYGPKKADFARDFPYVLDWDQIDKNYAAALESDFDALLGDYNQPYKAY